MGLAGRARRTGLGALLAVVACALAAAPAHAVLPPGFNSDTLVAVGLPTDLAFLPSGRILVTQQTGQLRAIDDSAGGATLDPVPLLDLQATMCTNGERGMLGVQPAEDVASTGHVFVYYTHKADNGSCNTDAVPYPYNRVSRFTIGADGLIDPATEVVLIDRIPSFHGNHNAGDLAIGHDGLLYVSVGDSGCDSTAAPAKVCGINNQTAQRLHQLNGKILRIDPDGSIPPSNPYTGPGTARCNTAGVGTSGTPCQEVFTYGLRNPFRIAFDSNDPGTRFFINDVGGGTWEEIDLGAPATNYGWPAREGFCAVSSTTDCTPVAGFTDPLYAYGHNTSCKTITGAAFVPDGLWPAAYEGDYLYADYGCGRMFTMTPGGTVALFANALGAGWG